MEIEDDNDEVILDDYGSVQNSKNSQEQASEKRISPQILQNGNKFDDLFEEFKEK